MTHSGDYCTTTTGTGVRWRATQSFILLGERNNLAASDPIYLTRESKDKNNCNVRENSDRRWLRECLKKAIGGGCADARHQRSAMGVWGRGCATTAICDEGTDAPQHGWVRDISDLRLGRDNSDRFLKKASGCGGADAQHQRSAIGARLRDNSDLR